MLAGSNPAPYCGLVRKSAITCGRVGVDAVDAGAGEQADDLEIMVADRGVRAEVVIRRADEGRALVGERLGG